MAEDAKSPSTARGACSVDTEPFSSDAALSADLNAETPSISFEIKNLSQINFEDITLVEKVGHGSYGVVYKAWLNDHFVAVKEFGPAAEQKVIETEIKQLSRVKHDNIIALYGRTSYQTFEYLIMEYAEGGSLHNFLHGKVKPYYSTAHAISWARQCAEGVAYLHAMKPKPMIHRDLKPLNLLLTNKGRHLKICDFGTVADKSTLMTNNRGSAAWMAPEVFEGNNYTEKCDIFSWSIVLWEVLSRQIPFKEIDNTYSIMWKIHKGVRPPLIKDCPEPIQNLMISCWATKPDERPSMQNVAAVMRALAIIFPGADEPLEYEYVDQQIITSNEDPFLDESKVSSLDFSAFHTFNTNSLTPTNMDSIKADSLTPTNFTNLLQLPQHAQPIAAITSTRWDVIPEESEPSYSSAERSAVSTDADILFNMTPTASAAKRYETIINGMYQMASVPMPPLSVDVDPNAWSLSNSSSSSSLAKSNGKERLTVTESKPLLVDSRTDATLLADEDSLTQLLDPELQPEPPIPGNALSEAIYREHQQLGNEHLRVVTELVYAQDFKEKILIQMDPTERQQKQEMLKKMSEKEELLDLYNNLKQQLEKLRTKQVANDLQGPQHCPQNTNAMQQRNINNNTDQTSPQQETVAEDGWVVVSSPSNS